MRMIGIYKITNDINGKCYIGQSIDIEGRRIAHLCAARNPNTPDYHAQIHQAIRKYGEDNFSFEILAELKSGGYDKDILNNLEKYYIQKYDSMKKGYNATLGGDGGGPGVTRGEKNGRAILTEKDVIHIRECYNAHIPFREVAKEYQDYNITIRGLQHIWSFETWKHIRPEYNTPENKYWHSHKAKANQSVIARDNKRHFTEEQVRTFRKEYFENGLTVPEIKIKYDREERPTTIRNAIIGKTYKDIK